jgi:diaminohydroxyphosphoribosylaminopyrimidine deaminase / 5-amino-6-(5-phosphoribosylamino)uracil reductase
MSQPDLPQGQDADFMRRALELAARGPLADPNPRVGAVVVGADGRVVGEGAHAGSGTPHAEVVALARAGAAARGGTAYVTLEPCDHTGRTGPCSVALAAAGIRRVVFGQGDPNPLARGGAGTLQAAGVDTTAGVLAAECGALNEPWTLAVSRGRPFVTWKLACTLDGRSAAADGTSRWITGAEARADVHDLRAACGAVLVGTGTVLADDPWLTVRHADGRLRERQPLRVVMGTRPIPPTARVLDDAADTLVLPEREPEAVLKMLYDKDIRHVWLEGGPRLAASFLRGGLVDEVIAYVAPALLGAGPAAVGDLGIPTIDRVARLEFTDVVRVGADVRLRARPASDDSATQPRRTGDQ